MAKKLFTFFCVCILVISCMAYAIAEVDQEILFRGIPWGTNLIEVKSKIRKDLGLGYIADDLVYGRSINNQAKGITGRVYYDNQCQYCHLGLLLGSLNIDIAGYTLSNLTLYYACVEDESGYLTRDLSDTSFYMGTYGILIKEDDDPTKMYKDLRGKLISLYGEPDLEENERAGINRITSARWNGKKDTTIILVLSEGLFDSINLSYAWTEGDRLMEHANAVYERQLEEENKNKPEVTVDPSNTNGL